MGFIITLIVISLVLSLIFLVLNGRDAGTVCACVTLLVFAVIVCFAIGISTYEYYDLHARLGAHKAYQGAIDVFVKHATPTAAGPNISVTGNEITDFKYQSYQGELGKLIRDARYNAAEYNRILFTKRAGAMSWYWRAVIVEPDDWMKPLSVGF